MYVRPNKSQTVFNVPASRIDVDVYTCAFPTPLPFRFSYSFTPSDFFFFSSLNHSYGIRTSSSSYREIPSDFNGPHKTEYSPVEGNQPFDNNEGDKCFTMMCATFCLRMRSSFRPEDLFRPIARCDGF